MISDEFTCKEVDPVEYADHILDLFNTVFHRRIQMDQFLWKYVETKPEKARVWVTIENKTNTVVAAVSAFKMIFSSLERKIVAYQLFDGMVKDGYRRHNFFSNMVLSLYDTLDREGVDLCFGYGNPKSIPALTKIMRNNVLMSSGHVFFFPIGLVNILEKFSLHSAVKMVLTFAFSPFFKLVSAVRVHVKTKQIRFVTLSNFDFINALPVDSVKQEHIIFPPRSSEYLSWKSMHSPEKNKLIIRIIEKSKNPAGYCILSRDFKRNVLVIQSIFCNDSIILRESITEVLRIASNLRCDGVLTNCFSEMYQKEYANLGFIKGNKVLCVVSDMKGIFHDTISQKNFWLQEPIDRDIFTY